MKLRVAVIAAGAMATMAATAASAMATSADCPNNGVVRFAVEPYESSAHLMPVYKNLGKLIGEKIGCTVKVLITTNYTAEIEAMRNNKLEIAQFGPLGYVLAHQVAGAEAVATFATPDGKPSTYTASIVTWPGSGIASLDDVRGKSFAFSDAASTSGHLFPAYGLSTNGIDPDHGVKAIYAGSHTSSYEALRHHKVKAGELNSEQIESAKQANEYKDGDFITLWKSDPIPTDPITVRGNLPAAFKARVSKVLANLDLSVLSEADRKVLVANGSHLVPATDHTYDLIRSLVHTLHIDLAKL
ncbi:phosphate/phosphite/phosphonate ABC transporter substrate-binding protein [Varunaivibrio sulfuroxidans]|uniref:Phosphonate transport system substrate-binding protein n=1 Tax=Varunaivibrio sulfuroxidans TaxID=1773489 RepID=A0A4R3JEG5_9PROT|nr:phosphate/phosphite/phosphonate ABC transporter substrate-binding protein [Varunaivibrio sulfuroxidans]TCS64282.1 phosphonate transport system substrate-binding protein [Varunaivibrio sulfuroxidans]WES31280.1 phosphate/phosphite/phosphonate ABC transporter substrate-binding protein [Varunaivibrio sulfuroxidans]